jgi:hypothetical protein
MKWAIYVAAFLIALVVAAGGFWYWQTQPQTVLELQVQTPCDLRQAACIARDASGNSIQFSINPTTIPLMQELTLSVQVQQLPAVQTIGVKIDGLNMYMGYQYAKLAAVDQHTYRGKLILPVCTEAHMQWQASVMITSSEHTYRAAFPFDTFRQ